MARSRIREGDDYVLGLALLMATEPTYFIAMDDRTQAQRLDKPGQRLANSDIDGDNSNLEARWWFWRRRR